MLRLPMTSRRAGRSPPACVSPILLSSDLNTASLHEVIASAQMIHHKLEGNLSSITWGVRSVGSDWLRN